MKNLTETQAKRATALTDLFVMSVRHHMLSKGWNQKKLSEGTGISSSYLSGLLSGKNPLTITHISVITDVLGMPVAFYGKGGTHVHS